MQRTVGCAIFAVIATLASAAAAQDAEESGFGSNLYAGIMGGLAAFDGIEGANYEFGFAASAFAGADVWENWRGEAELLYEAAEFENSADETSLLRISTSLYTDFGADWQDSWALYAGGGVGIVSIDVGNDTDNVDLSAHAEGGLSVPLGGNLHFVPGIRIEYIILDDIDDQIITQFRTALRLGL